MRLIKSLTRPKLFALKSFLFFIISQAIILFSFAQNGPGKITGIVKNGEGKQLEAVTVSLLKSADSFLIRAVVSNHAGQFEFENITNGKYLLSVTYVGYSNWHSKPFEITSRHVSVQVNDIALQPIGSSLNEVTVVGKRPLIENKIDRTVVNVDASATNTGLSALEVLEKSPGVTVDNDGNISLKGKQGVIVMIDGKPTYLNPTDLSNYLKNLPANQLDQVEIMTQPPAKYDASGNSGLINLITKKNKNNGFNGTITSSAIVAIYFKNTNSLTFNWRQGRTNVFGNYGYSYWEGFNDINIDKSLRQDASTPFSRFTTQHTFGRYSDRGQTFRAGLDFFADKKTTIGFVVNGTVDKEKFTSSTVANIFDSLHNFVQYNDAQSQNRSPQSHVGFNANLLRKLNKGAELSIDADYIFYNTQGHQYTNNYLFNSDKTPSESPYLLNGLLPSLIDIYSFKGDYKQPLQGDAVLEAGIKSSYVKTDNNADYTLFNNSTQTWDQDTAFSNHFIYKENINAAYLNLQKHMKKFSVQLGLRAEQTISEGNQIIKAISFHKNYLQVFPTAYFTYQPNDNNTYGLSFGRRIERPAYQNLNPFQFQLDRYTYEQGNPNLQPQFSNNIELSYNYKGQLNVSVNYTKTTDIINDVLIITKQPADSNYTTYQTTQNIASQRNIGISINYSKQIMKDWSLNAFINVFNNHYKGIIDGEYIDVGYTSFNSNFNTQYTFRKGWNAELSGFYNAKDFISSAILANGRGFFSLGAGKQVLNGKGTIKLNLRDPFYLMHFVSNTDLSKGVTHGRYVWDNRRIILTLVYRFGKAMNNSTQRKTSSASDEQSRVGGNNNQ